MEVVSVGVMYYAALLHVVVASIIASEFAAGMRIHPESFHVVNIPELSVESGIKMLIIAADCGLIAFLFCVTKFAAGMYTKYLNPYISICCRFNCYWNYDSFEYERLYG